MSEEVSQADLKVFFLMQAEACRGGIMFIKDGIPHMRCSNGEVKSREDFKKELLA